jgi:acyl carrier protein
MTRSVNAPNNDELEIRNSDAACKAGLPHTRGKRIGVRSKPLIHECVVAEIVRAIRAIRTSFPGRELNGETNLALDLGLESASRVELLLEVERTLDVALDVGVAAVFAELTIAELADLIMPTLQDDSTDRLPINLGRCPPE